MGKRTRWLLCRHVVRVMHRQVHSLRTAYELFIELNSKNWDTQMQFDGSQETPWDLGEFLCMPRSTP